MTFFTMLYKNGLWLAPPVFFLAIVLLPLVIFSLVRMMKKAELVRLPLVEQQEVEFNEAGTVVLWGEGPQLTTRFAWLKYRLTDRTGASVPGRITLPVKSSGFTRVKRTMRLFHIPQPGKYLLYVDRLGEADPRNAKCQLVFTKPFFGKVVLHILGILASSFLLIGSLVLFLLRLLHASPELEAGAVVSSSAIITAAGIIAIIIAAIVLVVWTNQRQKNGV
ncbi:MAG TPA: hypothetical protein PLI09_12265 [Candidatus Hydrogenedentes bacterium]|nr:hypothetical protein [Candidatus Hydrogenedentota bacterium]